MAAKSPLAIAVIKEQLRVLSDHQPIPAQVYERVQGLRERHVCRDRGAPTVADRERGRACGRDAAGWLALRPSRLARANPRASRGAAAICTLPQTRVRPRDVTGATRPPARDPEVVPACEEDPHELVYHPPAYPREAPAPSRAAGSTSTTKQNQGDSHVCPDRKSSRRHSDPGAGGPPPSGLSAEESRTYEQLNFFYTKGIGYGIEMITQPQTLYGIADSPVGLAAWMLNHDAASYSDIADAFAGHPVGNLTRDEVLDNVTFYWLTNTGISSARLYWENTFDFFGVKNVAIPAAVTVFPKEIYRAPRSWAERAYPKLIYFNEVDRGCHFAAWQEPTLFTAEMRAAFRSLR